jgi:hypothetical protein
LARSIPVKPSLRLRPTESTMNADHANRAMIAHTLTSRMGGAAETVAAGDHAAVGDCQVGRHPHAEPYLLLIPVDQGTLGRHPYPYPVDLIAERLASRLVQIWDDELSAVPAGGEPRAGWRSQVVATLRAPIAILYECGRATWRKPAGGQARRRRLPGDPA